jgi:hypothetical protein
MAPMRLAIPDRPRAKHSEAPLDLASTAKLFDRVEESLSAQCRFEADDLSASHEEDPGH